jgi:protein TonB
VIQGVSCPVQPGKPEYPRKALQDQVQGTIVVRATVNTDGSVSNPSIHRTSGMSGTQARMFQSAIFSNITGYKCGAQESPVTVEVEYVFKVTD